MQNLEQALKDICVLHEQVAHAPAPEIGPQAFLPFPPGVDPVAFAVEEVTQLKQWLRSQTQPEQQVAWVPRASIFTGPTSVCYLLEIPGVTREDISVSVAGGELWVRGQRRPPALDSSLKPMVVEQAWGFFERRFPIPAWCNSEAIRARYGDGVIEIQVSRQGDDPSNEFRVEIK